MAGPPTPTVIAAGVSCIMTNCNSTTNSCVYACVIADQPLSPSPPSPPHSLASSSQSHMAPFLIAAVCILGISFLLLTTCTIILRWRFTRHRRRRGNSNGNSPIDGDDGDISVVDHPIWHITTVGLQQSVIDSITAFKYKKLDHFLTEGSDCTVCLTQFEEGDDLRLLPKCSHAFHLSCIDMWLRSHKNCPLCRAPLVNEGFTGSNLAARSERWNNRQDTLLGDSEFQGILGSGRGESSSGHRGDDFGELPVEGIRIAEILKKNRELRIHSDLGVYYRFRRVDEEDEAGEGVLEPIKRSFSFNAVAASAICGEVSKGNEGLCLSSSSRNAGVVVPERKLELENVVKRGNSMSGLLMIKSSSIVGRSLQKGPVSMKRSVSSGSKLFSFRRTKSQASILPL